MSHPQDPSKTMDVVKEKPVLKQCHRTRPVMLRNWSKCTRRACHNAFQWLIMPLCTVFSTFAFLVLIVCCSATNKWATLKSKDQTWEQHIGIWHDCLSTNCWTDILFWPLIQTAQGFVITAVLCSFLLTTWLFGFFCTSPSLKMQCHLIFIILSSLTGISLFIAILLIVFILEKTTAVQNTYYVVLWPFYLLWLALILCLISCILGIISYKGLGQKRRRATTIKEEKMPNEQMYSKASILLAKSLISKSISQGRNPNLSQLSISTLGDNWTSHKGIYDAFKDL
ncbi:uncharacterized protein LOC111719369 [Sarcophilus harrisii]|uniref:uncharacterized protein LOC111719369 n=1 Tax=Sarcophilus harrisii TaxID=9305 RepID=UPI001301F6E2|nr:uncharacterized protein LOC111719369 [Sarcophilus harrisii]